MRVKACVTLLLALVGASGEAEELLSELDSDELASGRGRFCAGARFGISGWQVHPRGSAGGPHCMQVGHFVRPILKLGAHVVCTYHTINNVPL